MRYLPNRARLLALAARNQVGRMLGAAAAYSPAQRATAQIMWQTYMAAGYDDDCCAALLGDCDGETSFLIHARGDHDLAGGIAQWHSARRLLIKEHTGIDVWTAEAADQCRALVAEITEPWSAYRHVDAELRAAIGIEAKIAVLVAKFEQSGSQARDVARRTPMATFWKSQFGAAA